MKHLLSLLLASTLLPTVAAVAEEANPVVVIKTSAGTIKAELFKDKAPLTVANFLEYTEYAGKKHYDGTVFHRVKDGFMIQGGGIEKKADGTLEERVAMAPVKNESENGLKNDKGTLAMARRDDPNSATCQFFINTVPNHRLDRNANPDAPAGYCVFGKVIEGMDVVEKIEKVETGVKRMNMLAPDGKHQNVPMKDAPMEDVVIESVTVQGAGAAPATGAAPKKEEAKPAADPKPATDAKPAEKAK